MLGRPLYYREMHRGEIAQAVYNVKTKNMDSENWAKWAQDNPREAKLLANVERLIAELEDA